MPCAQAPPGLSSFVSAVVPGLFGYPVFLAQQDKGTHPSLGEQSCLLMVGGEIFLRPLFSQIPQPKDGRLGLVSGAQALGRWIDTHHVYGLIQTDGSPKLSLPQP